MSELKRCPLCGIEFVIEEDERYKYYTHPSVGCFFDNLPILVDDEDTISKWNTRKPMERIVERLEELKSYTVADTTLKNHEIVWSGLCVPKHEAIEIIKEVGEVQ